MITSYLEAKFESSTISKLNTQERKEKANNNNNNNSKNNNNNVSNNIKNNDINNSEISIDLNSVEDIQV